MLTDKQKELLDEFLSSIDYISCYFVGSSTVPFINNKHDIDIVVIVDKENKKRLDKNKLSMFRQSGLDVHLVDMNLFTKFVHWNNLFAKHYSGDNLDNDTSMPLKDIDNTKKSIVQTYNRLKDEDCSNHINHIYKIKLWYHIYTLLCYLKNDSYELTEEQIENINILHDREEKDIEKRRKLIDDMIKEIESWQI